MQLGNEIVDLDPPFVQYCGDPVIVRDIVHVVVAWFFHPLTIHEEASFHGELRLGKLEIRGK